MLETILRSKQAGRLEEAEACKTGTVKRGINVRKLLKEAIRPAKGCVAGIDPTVEESMEIHWLDSDSI
jgi:hypothetical protein